MMRKTVATGAIVVILLLVSFSAPVLSQAGGDATISNVSYAGDAVAETESGETVFWRDGPHEFEVEISSDGGVQDGALCLRSAFANGTGESELACQSVTVSAGGSTSSAVEFDAWPANLTGELTVRTVVRSADGERNLDEFSTDLTVLDRDGDIDEDGLVNEREVATGTDLRGNDTDGDGLKDGDEVHAYGTDPTSNDTDGDGIQDRPEIEAHQTDPTTADTDGDGLSDEVELANDTSPNVADTDGDGLDDALELTTYGTNATAPDTDGDGLDDGAEVRDHGTNSTNPDTDGDGLQDNLEIHTYETDPNAIDTDGDGLEDGTEVEEYRTDPTDEDTDDDGLLDGAEINTYGTNPTKTDTDGDGLTDAEEVRQFETDPLSSDTDGDGVPDPQEVERSQLASPELLRQFVVVVALAIALGSAAIYRSDGSFTSTVRRLFAGGDGRPKRETDEPTSHADGTAEAQRSASESADADGTTRTSGDDTTAESAKRADETTAAPDEPAEEGTDLDLLPNSQVVLSILDDHDGQIRQSELVEETGWSKAKVSRVLSKMESEEEIVKVSVGRGNLITTPNDVPSGVQSPFED